MNADLYMMIIIFLMGLGWIITLIAYFLDKRKFRIIKKNSDWAMERAREKAEVIIQEAKNAALKELTDVKVETSKYEKQLEEGVRNLTEQEISQYKQVIENITENVEGGVKIQSEQFKTEFEASWNKLQQELQDKIREDYEIERKKIEEYSGVKMREVEEKIAGIVDEAVLHVLGKQVDPQVNKKLIIAALEEAKKKYAI